MRSTRRWVNACLGMILALILMASPVLAGTLDDAINQVNQEYSNGQITDKVVRDNLILMLNDAKVAVDVDEQEALIESFRIMVWAQTGDEITQGAVDRLLDLVTGL